MRFIVSKAAAPKFKQNLAGLADRFEQALITAANMAASMIEAGARASIAQAGNFGGSWISGLQVRVEGSLQNMRISMTHEDPRVAIFETGGEIHGNPLLWIPISGTDAAGRSASSYGGLYSGNPPGHPPLLFSISDRQPKYFGISRVIIPQKFFLRERQMEVMSNFRSIFETAFRG